MFSIKIEPVGRRSNPGQVALGVCSVMAEWLEQASQKQEMHCHDLEGMSWNPDQIELGVHSVFV